MYWLQLRTTARFKLFALLVPLLLAAAACSGDGQATPTSPAGTGAEPTATSPAGTGAEPTATSPGLGGPSPTATASGQEPGGPPSDEQEFNFRLLISDDRLAIGDFSELLVTIEKVGVQQGGESGGWTEFDAPLPPDGPWTVDLTQLQGDNAQELLRVQLADGVYTKVFVHIDKETGVTGVLDPSGDPVTLKLPSSKLQIVKPFEIVAGAPAVDFVFDIAVVAAGNVKSPQGIKYLLLPVIGESGPDQSFNVLAADAPTADAGQDQTVATEATVQLDGSGSSDPEGDDLTFSWTLSVPEGSGATLSDVTTVDPTFVADVDGKYVATLVVNDGTSDSEPDAAEVEAEADPNEPPTADAGENQTVATGATVQLDGSGSSDLEGDDLTFSWTLSVPEGSDASLSDAAIVDPTFDADVDGEYVATLVVNDGTSNSDPDTVEIDAEP